MELTITERKGQLYADSREIAVMIGKTHHKLLRDIRTYINHFIESKIGYNEYFIESFYVSERNTKKPCYLVTRKGCDLIAHKLTGVKGTMFSVAYINRFYDMERALLERQSPQWQQVRAEGKKSRHMETNAIKAFIEYAESQGSKRADKYYIHFSQLANAAAGVKDRDTASMDELMNLRVAEQMINNLLLSEIAAGTEYHQAFQNVKNKVQQFSSFAFASGFLTGKAS
mgnify:CR=1 FL=1